MDLEIVILSQVGQWETNIICYHLHVESKKKKKKYISILICRVETDLQTLKNLWLPKGTCWGGEGTGDLGWSVLKLGCGYGYTTINTIKFIGKIVKTVDFMLYVFWQ